MIQFRKSSQATVTYNYNQLNDPEKWAEEVGWPEGQKGRTPKVTVKTIQQAPPESNDGQDNLAEEGDTGEQGLSQGGLQLAAAGPSGLGFRVASVLFVLFFLWLYLGSPTHC